MEIGIIIVLILCNAFFMASQFAIAAASLPALDAQAQSGSKHAQRVLAILNEPRTHESYLAAAQIGSTGSTLALGMYGAHNIAELLGPVLKNQPFLEIAFVNGIAIASALAILTYIHVVLGEMVPKSLAIQRSELLLPVLIWPMTIFMKLFYPITFVLSLLGKTAVGKSIGIDRTQTTQSAFTPEEIEFIVKESETEGILSDEIGQVIEQLFDFGERIAEDVMIPRVHMSALPMRPQVSDIKRMLSNSLHIRYPVYGIDKDDIVGSVHIKDLGYLLDSEGVCALPLRPVPFVPASASIQAVLDAMQEFSTHIAIVLDEYGGTAGLVTIQDIFEEVLGEFDESSRLTSIEQLENGTLRAVGTARLDELAEQLEVDIIHDWVTSVSGLVLYRLNRPPRVGDTVVHGRISIEVIRVKGRGVHTCIVKRLPLADDTEIPETE